MQQHPTRNTVHRMALDRQTVITRLNFILLGMYIVLVIAASLLIYQRERAATMRLVLEKARSLAGEFIGEMERLKPPYYDSDRGPSTPAFHDVTHRQHLINMIAMKEKYLIDVNSVLKRNNLFRPDDTEWRQMTWFRNPKVEEVDITTVERGERVLLYMRPLRMNERCLRCHGDYLSAPQNVRDLFPRGDALYGHKDQEFVGAVAVRVPMAHVTAEAWETIRRDVTWRSVIFLVIMVGAGVVIRRKIIEPLEEERVQLEADAISGARVVTVPEDADVATILRMVENLIGKAAEKTATHVDNESLYRDIVRLLPFPLLILTGEGRIAAVNQATENWFGLPHDALKNRPLEELIHDGETLREWLATARTSGTTRTFPTNMPQDDLLEPVEISVTVIDPQKKIFVARLSPRQDEEM